MIQWHMPKDRTTAPMSVFVLSVAYRVYRPGTGAMGARAPSAESSVNCVMLNMQCIARKSNPDSINCVKLRRVINVVDVSSLLTECSVFCLLIGVPCIRPGFPGHVLFLAFVRASGRVFENRRFVRVFGPIRKYIRTLPIAKAYDGMRQRKLVSWLSQVQA